MEFTMLATSWRLFLLQQFKLRTTTTWPVLFLTSYTLVGPTFTVQNSCQWLLLKLEIMVTLFLHFLHKSTQQLQSELCSSSLRSLIFPSPSFLLCWNNLTLFYPTVLLCDSATQPMLELSFSSSSPSFFARNTLRWEPPRPSLFFPFFSILPISPLHLPAWLIFSHKAYRPPHYNSMAHPLIFQQSYSITHKGREALTRLQGGHMCAFCFFWFFFTMGTTTSQEYIQQPASQIYQ